MKIFPLATAYLLVVTFKPVAGQREKVSLLRGSIEQEHSIVSVESREAAEQLESINESTCLQFEDESSCNGSTDENGIVCVWCKCSAIPSECLNVDQSKAVPPGVFDCASPPEEENYLKVSGMKASLDEFDVQTDATGYDSKLYNYSLKDGTVDGNLCDPTSKSLAGYVDISGSKYDAEGENKHLFYWFFEKRSKSIIHGNKDQDSMQDSKEIPIVLWLTGGPGCSSTLALLFENGPCKVSEDGQSTSVNPYSWTESAHVLWLDQPSGVGYSHGTENDYNEEMISEDTFFFLQEFFKEHPEYSKSPLTIVGESYGGHYAPAVAHKIWIKNKFADEAMVKINLTGLGIGNGLTNPEVQYKYYPEMAVNNSHGYQIVSDGTYTRMKSAVPPCVKLIQECNKGDSFINRFACQTAYVTCSAAETIPYQMTGLNPYDIRKHCDNPPLCYDFSNIETFLNLDSTKSSLHVSEESKKWVTCNMGVNMKFHSDWMHDFSPYVADLLNDGIHVLVYAGDVDYICNYLGNKAWTLNLEWRHKQEFNDADDHEWGVDENKFAGLARASNGFTFLQVYDAGHMVPADKPKVALDMITNFLSKGDF